MMSILSNMSLSSVYCLTLDKISCYVIENVVKNNQLIYENTALNKCEILKQINVDIYLIYTEKGYTFVKINYLDFPKVQKYYKYLNFQVVRFYGKKYYSFILKKYYLVFISFILIITFVSFLSFFIVILKH